MSRTTADGTPPRAALEPNTDLESAVRMALVEVVGAIVVCDADGRVRICSPEAVALLGPVGEGDGRTVDTMLAQRTARRRPCGPLASALAGRPTRFAATLTTPRGVHIEVLVKTLTLTSPGEDRVIGAAMVVQQRGPLSKLSERQLLGLHDPLTGLANRQLLGDRMQQAIARAQRGGRSFVVFMIDLDGFKRANDEHGHEYGDELLRKVGARLAQAARPSDTVARIGGDEFVAICEDIPSETALAAIADRLLAAAIAPVWIGGLETAIGASVGMTLAGGEHDVDKLLHQADLAMYEAKRRGRNNWARFDDHLAEDAHRLAHLVSELRAALASGTVTVAYQPEIDLLHGVTVGYEALVRWKHPTLGDVPAVETIAAAERNELIHALGALVLDRACAEAAQWQDSDRADPLWISVNVSARELIDPGYAQRVEDTLARWRLPGSRLVLELTESIMIETSTTSEHQIERLHAAGVRFAIDDFGTGYASLTYLQRLHIDQVKIDRSFVERLSAGHADDVIVTGVIGLAHNLDLAVVAEGIETDAQAELLRSLGCDIGQGYLFGHPRPAIPSHTPHRH
jgi:diguanylate cyclase (GGDEF)-like protein